MMVLAIQREKRRYIQHFDANRLHSEKRWIQSNSMDLLFFFSFSPFYLLLSQRRTFLIDSSVWNHKNFGGEKEKRRRKRRRREGETALQQRRKTKPLSSCFWSTQNCSEGVLGQNFIKEEEEEKREKKFTKSNVKCFVCVSLFPLFIIQGCGQL